MTATNFTAIDLDAMSQIRVAILPNPPYGAQLTLSARPFETFDDKDIRRGLEPRYVRELIEALRPGALNVQPVIADELPPVGDTPNALLSTAEHQALDLLHNLWNLVVLQIIGFDSSNSTEAAERIWQHLAAVGDAIKAQAAARAFPHRYTLLGKPSLR